VAPAGHLPPARLIGLALVSPPRPFRLREMKRAFAALLVSSIKKAPLDFFWPVAAGIWSLTVRRGDFCGQLLLDARIETTLSVGRRTR
jgi:hypothetical protein